MELIVELAVGALAAARFAYLVIVDDFGPIRDVRNWVRYRWPAEDDAYYESEVTGDDDLGWQVRELAVFRDYDPDVGVDVWYPVDPHPLGTLFSCVRCMSVWTGLAVSCFVLLAPAWATLPALLPFAYSQITISLRADV